MLPAGLWGGVTVTGVEQQPFALVRPRLGYQHSISGSWQGSAPEPWCHDCRPGDSWYEGDW